LIFQLPDQHVFPNPELADSNGLLALGGDLSAQRVLLAYKNGIFPWFSDDEPILWWSPNPRYIILSTSFKASKSMRPVIRKYNYTITVNKAFESVIANCKLIDRKDQQFDSWITDEMQQAYIDLYKLGHAISVEMWNENEELCGGLYGVVLGTIFCGESMFAKTANASKIAFIHFANFLFRSLFLKLLKVKQSKAMSYSEIGQSFAKHFKKLQEEKSVFF